MSNSSSSEPTPANIFHAGSTCPFCQESVDEGQMVVKCNRCGSVHHETCWNHKHACSSYHCDEKVNSDAGTMEPELVITNSQLENVTVPAKPARMTPQEASRPYLKEKPTSLSKLAVFSIVLSVFSFIGIWGAISGNTLVLASAIAVGIASIIIGVIAMVIINTSNKKYGFAPAGTGILLSGALILFFFVRLHTLTKAGHANLVTDIKIIESMPSDAELERMIPYKANAMRANVVIRTGGPGVLSAGEMYGSGTIVSIKDNKAYILTNKHVIGDDNEDAQINILFHNGERSEASVEWKAPEDIDIVILSSQALTLQKFKSLVIAPKLAQHGEPVFAVGNPLNLAWSYTEGVISGIRRQQQTAKGIAIYQTQTPINHGNSGGGLYDMKGRLIGINTWTKDKSVAEGLNFAIATESILKLLGDDGCRQFLKPEEDPEEDNALAVPDGKEKIE